MLFNTAASNGKGEKAQVATIAMKASSYLFSDHGMPVLAGLLAAELLLIVLVCKLCGNRMRGF